MRSRTQPFGSHASARAYCTRGSEKVTRAAPAGPMNSRASRRVTGLRAPDITFLLHESTTGVVLLLEKNFISWFSFCEIFH